MDELIANKEAHDMDEARKELLELMASESKPNFTNILWRLPNLGQILRKKISSK